MNKKEKILKQIDLFDNRWFNEDQKDIAKKLIELTHEKEVDKIFDFIKMKRRTGFAFDYSPNPAKGRIIKPTLTESFGAVCENANKLLIGDNYNALKVLNLTHKEKVDIIYIDPPYNTEAMKDDGNHSSKEEGDSIKFRYKDKFGRTGWLNMMKERLVLARELLTNNGIIFISIDDSEQAYLKVLMDEIFGFDNFISNISWLKGNAQNDAKNFQRNHEYILCYSKNFNNDMITKKIVKLEEDNKKLISLTTGNDNTFIKKPNLGQTIYYNEKSDDIIIKQDYDPTNLDLIKTNDESRIYKTDLNLLRDGYVAIRPPKVTVAGERMLGRWSIQTSTMNERKHLLRPIKNRNGEWTLKIIDNREYSMTARKSFIDASHLKFGNGTSMLGSLGLDFDNPKPIALIQELIGYVAGNENATILDFFAGSGSTGHAVMEMNRNDGGNRKFILATNNQNNIAEDVTIERLHRLIIGKDKNGNSDFKWLNKNKPYKNESMEIYKLDDSVVISVDEKNTEKIQEEILLNLQKINPKYKPKVLDLYYDLSALNPLEK